MLKVSKLLTSDYRGWKSWIFGEYWLHESGEAEFADGDTGDRGHEQIAVENIFNHFSTQLENAFIKYFQKVKEKYPEEYPGAIEGYSNFFRGTDPDDFTLDNAEMSDLYYNYHIPVTVGEEAFPPGQWDEFNKDIRLFYSKYFKAAHVINNNFSVWQLTPRMINAMQDFVLEKADENGLDAENPLPGSICVDEISTNRYAELDTTEFLMAKHANQIFQVVGKTAAIRKTPAQKQALDAYNRAVANQDRYMGSVFVTPQGSKEHDLAVEKAYQACIALGMTYEHGL